AACAKPLSSNRTETRLSSSHQEISTPLNRPNSPSVSQETKTPSGTPRPASTSALVIPTLMRSTDSKVNGGPPCGNTSQTAAARAVSPRAYQRFLNRRRLIAGSSGLSRRCLDYRPGQELPQAAADFPNGRTPLPVSD